MTLNPAPPPRSLPLSRLLADAAGHAPEVFGAVVSPGSDPLISAVVHDHREVTPGALFVARSGARFDAHRLIPQALARGAVAVLGERPVAELAAELTSGSGSAPYLAVSDARRALPQLAAAFYDRPSRRLSVLGVTGTDGKTTTSYLLQHVLDGRFATGLISTAGVRLGASELPLLGHFTTPEATDVQRLLATFVAGGATHAVLESSSHGFSLHRLDAVDYAAGIVTNLSPEHLDHHRTMAAYLEAKATLVRRSGRVALNLDDEHYGAFAAIATAAGVEVITYGQGAEADVSLTGLRAVPGGLDFALTSGGETLAVQLPLLGAYNAWNAAAAVALAQGEGVPPAEAVARLRTFPGVPGRMQVLQAEPYTVVVDFAHTAPALSKALAAVRPTNGRVIVVVGAAGERDPGKRAPLGGAAIAGSDLAIFTEEDSRSEPFAEIAGALRRGATAAGGSEGTDFVIVEDREWAITAALERARPGDLVILAGKGHERTLERANETIPWDEAALTRRLLAEL